MCRIMTDFEVFLYIMPEAAGRGYYARTPKRRSLYDIVYAHPCHIPFPFYILNPPYDRLSRLRDYSENYVKMQYSKEFQYTMS